MHVHEQYAVACNEVYFECYILFFFNGDLDDCFVIVSSKWLDRPIANKGIKLVSQHYMVYDLPITVCGFHFQKNNHFALHSVFLSNARSLYCVNSKCQSRWLLWDVLLCCWSAVLRQVPKSVFGSVPLFCNVWVRGAHSWVLWWCTATPGLAWVFGGQRWGNVYVTAPVLSLLMTDLSYSPVLCIYTVNALSLVNVQRYMKKKVQKYYFAVLI